MARRQYVNLTNDTRGELAAERVGDRVKLRAKVTPARALVKVFFKRTPDPDNLDKSVVVKTKSARTNLSGVAKIEFRVSKIGGDKFTFEAYTQPGRDDSRKVAPVQGEDGGEAVTYEVWRRLY